MDFSDCQKIISIIHPFKYQASPSVFSETKRLATSLRVLSYRSKGLSEKLKKIFAIIEKMTYIVTERLRVADLE